MKTKSTTKPKRQPRVRETLVVVNLADLGKKPQWKMVEEWFRLLPPGGVSVLLHLLAFHLGTARGDHEDDPGAPGEWRGHCSGRASAVNKLMAEVRALSKGEGEKVSAGLRGYFGEETKS